ncbi:glycosyl hydrolase family 8 [Bosea sp. CCNWLW174]|uniref:glycosyl hydrolase family 8 n=1 Tax=unclassified Bosea (in: a-proteobacteria) TaxID=2653178 RepID=UPI003014B120
MARNPSLAGTALVAALAAGSGGAAAAPQSRSEVTAVNPNAPASQSPQGAMLLAKNWPSYRAAFVRPEGRVVDNGNGNISHSEGQGYALVLAVATQDREAFDLIWRWTARELYIRDDGLAAWRWEPGSSPNVTDRNNASDGDLLIAWALGEAGARWDVPEYTQAMKRISAAIFKHNVVKSRVGPVLLPGSVGFDAKSQPDGPVVNLSYWVFPAIDRLEVLAPEHDWAGLRRSGLTLVSEGRFGPLRIPPEWLALGSERSAPATQFERRFSYNAIRIPLYLAWSNRVSPEHLRPFVAMWNAAEDIGPFIIDIDDGKASGKFDGAGYRLIFALAQCVAAGRTVPAALVAARNELYYPATLALLSTLAISERRPKCL